MPNPKQKLTITVFSSTRPLCCQREVVDGLLEVLRSHHLAATWAMDYKSTKTLGKDLVLAGHEQAIHGAEVWTGHGAGRARFVREFDRHIKGFQSFGVRPSTLVLPHTQEISHLDVLVKQGITTVARMPNWNGARETGMKPSLLRWGLWEISQACCVPTQRLGWFADHGARMAVRQITRGPISHLAIDLEAIITLGHSARRLLERVLRVAVHRRDVNLLENLTLATFVSEQVWARSSPSTESIIRRAA